LKLAIVVERPTQFDAPFFRYAAQRPGHALQVLFTDPASGSAFHDPELERAVDWGFDLRAGYDNEIAPAGAGRGWWEQRLRGLSPDLVVVNGYTQPAYLRAALGARGARRRVALRIDSVSFARGPSALRRGFVRFVLGRLFAGFLATGSLTRRYLEDCGVPPAQVGLFPYTIDDARFRDGARLDGAARGALRGRYAVPAEARLVLAVAKLSPREAPWDLLRAWAGRRDPSTFVLIAGDGPLRTQLEQFAKERGMENMRFAGYVPYPELPALYGAADLFVHAPREERWGVSVAEALAAGLPVVACSRVGAAHDLVAGTSSGFLYDAGREDQLMERIREALTLDREVVRAAARERLASWNHAATWRHLLQAAKAS